MKYSVIATSFNDSKEIIRYLKNICDQSLLPDEIIIVDGGSKDNTTELIKDFQPPKNVTVKCIDSLGRLNISQGYNIALIHAKNDIVLITGIGNLYNKDFAKELILKFEEGKYDMVTGPTYGYVTNKFSKSFTNGFLRGSKGKQYLPCNRCVLLNKNLFKETGFFYENFIYAGEDTEFYLRAIKKGFKVGYTPKAKTYWFVPQNYNQYKKKWKVNAIADMQLFDKNIIINKIILRLLLAIAFILSICFFYNEFIYWMILLIIICGLMIKFKTSDVFGIYLRIAEEYYIPWYYIKQWQYTKKEYHFDASKIPFFSYE